jgi:hypothetical protein
LPPRRRGVAFAVMPRRALPDITDIDPVELELEALAVLEERLGRDARRLMQGERLSREGGRA